MSNTLATALGISAAKLVSIWELARANGEKLASCHLHQFAPGSELGAKKTCINCGGEIGAVEAAWYERGIEHASRKS